MAWWVWIVGGVLLCLAEMATPGAFYLLFFGVAALVVGVLAWVGLVETTWVQFSPVFRCLHRLARPVPPDVDRKTESR